MPPTEPLCRTLWRQSLQWTETGKFAKPGVLRRTATYDPPVRINRDVAVVVPMHNEACVIAEVISDLLPSFSRIICVDDGSSDGSADIAEAAGARVIRHAYNVGQGAAIQTGLMYALGSAETRFVVTFDADGQHRVADALSMLEVARSEPVDVVLGSRFLGRRTNNVPAGRRALLRAAVVFTRFTSGLPVTDAHNGLRVMNRFAASRLDITLCGMAHASEIVEQIARQGLRWVEHPVTIDYSEYSRAKGQSNVNAINISLDLLGRRLTAAR